MAKYAELGVNNIVLRVVCVDNMMITDSEGVEQEQLGIDFLKSLFGQDTIWKQTSFTGAFRKNYAGIDFTYDPKRDAFINPRPIVEPEMEQYVSFDEDRCLWVYNPPKLEIGVTRL